MKKIILNILRIVNITAIALIICCHIVAGLSPIKIATVYATSDPEPTATQETTDQLITTLEDTGVTVSIISFTRGNVTNLRSSELLQAKVSGYDGNTSSLTYTWENNLGTYLYIYNSHNMYNIKDTSGEISISAKGTDGGKNYAWASVYGAQKYASGLSGGISVTVTDANGNVVGTAEYTRDFLKHDLDADMTYIAFGLFTGEKANVKDLLGKSAVVHVDCQESTITDGTIVSGGNYIGLSKEGSDYYITGLAKGEGHVDIDLSKNNCKFHQYTSGTADTLVMVFQRPATSTTSTTLTLTDLDPDCDYYLDGVKGKEENGKVIFTGLDPETKYTVTVKASVSNGTGQSQSIYAYVSDTTKEKGSDSFNIDIEVNNGSHDLAGDTITVQEGNNQTITFSPKPGFILESVLVNGTPAKLTNNSFTFSNVSKNQNIHVNYAADANGDQIPDKYQKTVTFKVVNGTWADGSTTDISSLVTLIDKDNNWSETGTATVAVPSGMIPDAAHKAPGSWDAQLNGEVTVNADASFTYTFDKIKDHEILISVQNGSHNITGDSVTVMNGASQTITFEAKPGYILETVTVDGAVAVLTDGSYTFSNVTQDHTIRVTYTEDANDDQIPDKYQKTITFKVVNGTWEDGTNDQLSTLVTLKNAQGEWSEEGSATVTIPSGMIPDIAFQNAGSWDAVLGETVEVTDNAVYTYTFGQPKTYQISVVVQNGTHDLATDSVTVNYGASQSIHFTPNDGFTLDLTTVDGLVARLTDGSYTFSNVTANHNIYVQFAEDANGDQIPDKYQKTVTFDVVNGTWADGTCGQLSTLVTLKDAQGNWSETGFAVLAVPSGMIPANGWQNNGQWDKELGTTVTITDNSQFIYAFTNLNEYLISVQVENGTTTPGSSVVKHGGSLNISFAPNTGYKFGSLLVDGTPVDPAGNQYSFADVTENHSLIVTFIKDTDQTQRLGYTVKHIADGKLMDEQIYTADVWMGDLNPMIQAQTGSLGAKTYVGYKLSAASHEAVDGDMLLPGTVITYTYIKDESQVQATSYKVQHIVAGNLEKEKIYYASAWVNETAPHITVQEETIKPLTVKGYKLVNVTPQVQAGESVPSGTVIVFQYARDDAQLVQTSYTVKHMVEGREEFSKTYTGTAWINDNSPQITVVPGSVSPVNYTGYKLDKVDNLSEEGSSISSGTQITFYYVKDESQTKEISYSVRHIMSDIEQAVFTFTEKCWVNEENPMITIQSGSLAPKNRPGYSLKEISKDVSEGDIVPDGTEIVLRYGKNSYTYTVEYYFDGELDEAKVEHGSALYGSIVESVADMSGSGYVLDYVDGLPLTISDNPAENIVSVYYAADQNEDGIPDKYQATITYRIENGSWADGAFDDITVLFNLKEKKDGHWVEAKPTLNDTIPTGMLPSPEYTGSGEWSKEINSSYAVKNDETFVYFFGTIKTYNIKVQVLNGKYELPDNLRRTMTVSSMAGTIPVVHRGSQTIHFVGNEGYALDAVYVDGTPAKLHEMSYTFQDIVGDHEISVSFAEDSNGDSIPDKYQKKVTFKIQNGTWADGSNGTIDCFATLMDSFGNWNTEGNAQIIVPEGMNPADGYMGGSWDIEPNTTVSGTGAVVYTYSFHEIPPAVTPETGDPMPVSIMIGLMIASAMGLVVLAKKRSTV